MDSYSFHFERMSNLDLHPLSLPVSRLSPAKSTSSIDQYTHHHSKGDSAYSSFSGGSSAPDYPSPFLPDDFHPHGLQYADLKYVKGVYSSSILESDSKSMDKLYRSMEAIAQQNQHHQNNTRCPHIKDSSELSTPLTPPPPPVRLDSFVTTRNLESSRARQSPEGQHADTSTFRTQTTNPETLGQRPDPGYGWRVSQHYQRDQPRQDVADKIQESATVLSRLSTQASQPEHSQQTQGSQSETQQKRLHSTHGVSVSEQQRPINSWHMAQNTISGSIQHKGQFYFVTGVYKSPESSIPQAQCVAEASSTEPHRQVEHQRSHSTVENMLKNAQMRKPSSPEGPNGKLFFQEDKKLSEDNEPPSNHVFYHFHKAEQTSQNVDNVEDSQRILNMDIGRHHTTNHPIFYCGPEMSFSPSDMAHTVNENDQNVHTIKDEPANSLMRPPLADVPTEKISKETTPLLYHLMSKVKNDKNSRLSSKDPDEGKDKKAEKESSDVDSTHSDVSHKEKLNEYSYPCNTLDDSYKKYYKAKLKDAQTKVLRETSFKRKDLQLSRPNRIEQWSDKRLSVIPAGLSSQAVHSKLENSIHPYLPKLQQTDKETLRNPSVEIEKEIEKQTETQKNIAQPQVPRIGSRKRLTPEQKKLSHSEPEKLHQLADRPVHMTCRSLGSETEALLSEDNQGDPGLVASRRKMFETRGRTLSASSLSKHNLKHLQHKALVAYMERKTGHKVAEPQQPAPQVPSQRHSTAGRHSDWGPRPHSANASSKKKLLRPLSAGRILDSSSSRSAQFTLAEPSVHSRQPNWIEGPPPSGKCASVENLLDEQKQHGSVRTRSISTPHSFHQINRHFESSSAHESMIASSQVKVEGEASVYKHYARSVPEQWQKRVMAPRGKSLEELGVSKAISPRALSKSSEQLHHEVSGREKRDIPFLTEKHKYIQRKQDCAPLLDLDKNTQVATDPHAFKEALSLDRPSTLLHSRVRASNPPSASSGSEFNCVPSCDGKPQIPMYGDGYNSRDVTCTPSSSKEISENNIGVSIMKAVPQERTPDTAEESSGDVSEVQRCNFGHEVPLSLGVTTDPSLWILSPEINDANMDDDTASQPAVSGHHQNTQSAPCAEVETAPNTDPDAESSPAVHEDQERKEKEMKTGPEKLDGGDSKDQPRWETLVQEVVSADQSLARVLFPITNRKTALMLMEQLLSEDTLLMEEHYKKKQEQKSNEPEPAAESSEMTHDDKVNNSLAPNEDLTAQQQQGGYTTEADVTEKKRQLMVCIERQLKSLEGLRSSLQGEERENGCRGDAIEALVRECCVPAELERYTQFIGDLERVVNLLLCLSARLARVQNALSTVDDNTDTEEKQSLDNRYHLLCKQREDAKDLKDNLDRRERMVSTFLARQLTDVQLQEYRHFVQTKASLLIRQKDLDEKQRLGEEQLEALLNSIPP